MKKVSLSILLFIMISIFMSCEEEKEQSPGLSFVEYDTFTNNKAAWIEPEKYEFTYIFQGSGSPSLFPVTVTVTENNAVIDYGENELLQSIAENSELTRSQLESEGIFTSVAEIYSFFENRYQEALKSINNSSIIVYSASYEKASDKLFYPSCLKVSVSEVDPDLVLGGYSGMSIKITTLKIEQ